MSISTPQSPNTPEPTYTPPPTTLTTPPLTGSANISVREYIYFLPHPLPPSTPIPYTPSLPDKNPLSLPAHPFEPTNTLVLTSPAKTFIDLRYLRPTQAGETTLPNAGERGRLEWGFAGTSASTPAPASPHHLYGEFGHSTWMHWLDSRFPVGQAIPADEGDMYDLGDGRFLEHGHAFHPHLGRVAGHEELWRDVEARATGQGAGVVCIVLRCQDDGRGVRGVVVRLGQFCQGILHVGGDVTTERWECEGKGADEQSEGEQRENWKRTARTGNFFLPCAVAFRRQAVALGGKVRYGEFEWVVEECWEWA